MAPLPQVLNQASSTQHPINTGSRACATTSTSTFSSVRAVCKFGWTSFGLKEDSDQFIYGVKGVTDVIACETEAGCNVVDSLGVVVTGNKCAGINVAQLDGTRAKPLKLSRFKDSMKKIAKFHKDKGICTIQAVQL
jgi:hypothetical protein